MERETILEKLRAIREVLGQIKEGTDNPAIERSVHLADMYCHMAQWELGDDVPLMPDLE